MKLSNILLAIASFYGMTSVIIGAFASHYLRNRLVPKYFESIKTAVTYQMMHAIVIIILITLYFYYKHSIFQISSFFFIVGTLLFSGSIYFLVYANYTFLIYPKWIGVITPVGGALLIIGWLLMMISAFLV